MAGGQTRVVHRDLIIYIAHPHNQDETKSLYQMIQNMIHHQGI